MACKNIHVIKALLQIYGTFGKLNNLAIVVDEDTDE